MGDLLATSKAMGFTLPSAGYLSGMLLFSIIGMAAWAWGKRTDNTKVKVIAWALMLYTYLVSSTALMFAIGLGLCAALYFYRND